MSKNDSLTQNDLSQHIGFVGREESNANALEPDTGTPCIICGEFVEGWDFPICHECRKRLKNILYAPIGQLNPEGQKRSEDITNIGADKRGDWIFTSRGASCSVCGSNAPSTVTGLPRECPVCGAKMYKESERWVDI